MSGREYHSAVIIKTDTCLLEIRELKKMMQEMRVKVDSLVPQSNLQPFSKPAQKDVGRDLNVANWFRSKTIRENEKLSSDAHRKYLEFPADVSDEHLNDDMKRTIHGIMCERLRPGWETKSWHSIYSEDKRTGEQIIKEAACRPEFAVIAQSAGYWAIRTIAEQRQKSTKRAAEQRNARSKKKMTTHKKKGHSSMVNQNDSDPKKVDSLQEGSKTDHDEDVKDAEDHETENVPLIAKDVSMTEPAVSQVRDVEPCENQNYSDESSNDGDISDEEMKMQMESTDREDRHENAASTVEVEEENSIKIKSLLEILSPLELHQLLPDSVKNLLADGKRVGKDDVNTTDGKSDIASKQESDGNRTTRKKTRIASKAKGEQKPIKAPKNGGSKAKKGRKRGRSE